MNIGLDIMGGDFAPEEAIKGVAAFFDEPSNDTTLTLVGDKEKAVLYLAKHNLPTDKISLVHAAQVIEMNDHPTKALREKPDSSIAVGLQLLATGRIDAFISAGNTGAVLVGSVFNIKPLEGVLRPTISTIIPKENGATGLLLDVGMNADCKPEYLNQFAVMGAVYAQQILGIANPRVALINVGEEEGKGNQLAQATYPLLKENSQLNFIGNIEGRDLLLDRADVMVCDGFTGNIILKMAESIYEVTRRQQIHNAYFDRFNFESYGGTPILGIAKPVIIGHGISKAIAFKNMILAAAQMVEKEVMIKMKSSLG